MSGFRPDTKGTVEDSFLFFLAHLFSHSAEREGGMLQTNNTGVCSQYLSHTGPAPAHGACSLPAHPAQTLSRLLHWEPSEAGPRLPAPPRSKLLRFRRSGSPQRCRLSRACILCPSQVLAAEVMRCLASAAGTYHLPCPCH